MADIIRRIKKTGEITSTADYQIMRLNEMGKSNEYIQGEIKRYLKVSDEELDKIFAEVIEKDYTRNKTLYEATNTEFIPYEKNQELIQLVDSLKKQTSNILVNFTNSMGFTLDYGKGKKVFTPLSQYYQQYLDNAIIDILTGTFDYNSVLRKTVTAMTNSGLRSIDFASGYTTRAPVAARRAVFTALSQLTGKISETNAQKLNTDFFEVAYHEGARPSHQEWQGKVWSRNQLETVCGLGSVLGLAGINCYHTYYLFVKGVSKRSYSDEELKKLHNEENKPKKWNGKDYAQYEALQQQRKYETLLRVQRQKIRLLQKGRADEESIMNEQIKYKSTLREYAKFSNRMDLPEQKERIYMDMLGRVVS